MLVAEAADTVNNGGIRVVIVHTLRNFMSVSMSIESERMQLSAVRLSQVLLHCLVLLLTCQRLLSSMSFMLSLVNIANFPPHAPRRVPTFNTVRAGADPPQLLATAFET